MWSFSIPGLQGIVNITAYDASIYDGLEANLEKISADTFSDSKGNSLFRIHLRTKSNAFKKSGTSLPIIPGMNASVNILTGKKSILSYILNPIRRIQQYALTENDKLITANGRRRGDKFSLFYRRIYQFY